MNVDDFKKRAYDIESHEFRKAEELCIDYLIDECCAYGAAGKMA